MKSAHVNRYIYIVYNILTVEVKLSLRFCAGAPDQIGKSSGTLGFVPRLAPSSMLLFQKWRFCVYHD